MKYDVGEILKELNEGKINCEKAVNLIKEREKNIFKKRKASKIKITVIEKSSNTSIKLPGIHFSFLNLLANTGISITKIIARRGKEVDEDFKMMIDVLEEIELKTIFNELRNCGPFDFVHVQEGKDTDIRIRIL